MVSFISPRNHKYIKGIIILDNKNNILFMTEHYSKEWMYRHEHYWKMVTKYTILCTAIIFMPYLSNIGIELPNQNNSIFFFSSRNNFICYIWILFMERSSTIRFSRQ